MIIVTTASSCINFYDADFVPLLTDGPKGPLGQGAIAGVLGHGLLGSGAPIPTTTQ